MDTPPLPDPPSRKVGHVIFETPKFVLNNPKFAPDAATKIILLEGNKLEKKYIPNPRLVEEIAKNPQNPKNEKLIKRISNACNQDEAFLEKIKGLQDPENIMGKRLYDLYGHWEIVKTKSECKLIMDYYPYGDLFQYFTTCIPLGYDTTIKNIFFQIIDLFCCMYGQGFYYTDLKEHNIAIKNDKSDIVFIDIGGISFDDYIAGSSYINSITSPGFGKKIHNQYRAIFSLAMTLYSIVNWLYICESVDQKDNHIVMRTILDNFNADFRIADYTSKEELSTKYYLRIKELMTDHFATYHSDNKYLIYINLADFCLEYLHECVIAKEKLDNFAVKMYKHIQGLKKSEQYDQKEDESLNPTQVELVQAGGNKNKLMYLKLKKYLLRFE